MKYIMREKSPWYDPYMRVVRLEPQHGTLVHGLVDHVAYNPYISQPHGFLLGRYDYPYEIAHHHYWGCFVEEDLVGFVSVYDAQSIKNTLGVALTAHGLLPPWMIRQVGILPTYQGRGIITLLYDRIFDEIQEDIGTTIATNPPNPASMAAHIRLGFRVIHNDLCRVQYNTTEPLYPYESNVDQYVDYSRTYVALLKEYV